MVDDRLGQGGRQADQGMVVSNMDAIDLAAIEPRFVGNRPDNIAGLDAMALTDGQPPDDLGAIVVEGEGRIARRRQRFIRAITRTIAGAAVTLAITLAFLEAFSRSLAPAVPASLALTVHGPPRLAADGSRCCGRGRRGGRRRRQDG